MKKYVSLLILIAILCTSFTACGRNKDPLKKFEGWWKRPDGYSSMDSTLPDTFKIEPADSTLTCYSEYGVANEKYVCRADGEILTVEIPGVGDVTLILKSGSLVDPGTGNTEYVKGAAVTPSENAFIGKWYRGGDTSNNYYVISDVKYECHKGGFSSALLHSGSYTHKSALRFTADGTGYEELSISLSNSNAAEGYSSEYEYVLLCGGLVLFDVLRSQFYLRDSAIKTSDGIDARSKMTLVCDEWVDEADEERHLRFGYYSSTVELVTKDGTEIIGAWRFKGGVLTVEYTDKSKDVSEISDGRITLKKLDATFIIDKE